MFYQCIPVGIMQVNCYLVGDESTRQAVLIDPGAEGDRLVALLREKGWNLSSILLTHGHFDHIGAIDRILSHIPEVPIYIHPLDAAMLSHPEQNLSFMNGSPVTANAADLPLLEGDRVSVGEGSLTVYHTPGHSSGSVSFYTEGVLFSGDTLFYESIGRFDFGNYSDILVSLDRLLKLPEETIVLPGHGPKTSIGHEKHFNPYAR